MELYNEQTERWMDEHVEETQQLLRTLCQIPAPSHHEEKRAEFCRDWLLKNASPDASVSSSSCGNACPASTTSFQMAAASCASLSR